MPASVRRLGRDDIAYVDLAEERVTSPVLMSFRAEDRSPRLAVLRGIADALRAAPPGPPLPTA